MLREISILESCAPNTQTGLKTDLWTNTIQFLLHSQSCFIERHAVWHELNFAFGAYFLFFFKGTEGVFHFRHVYMHSVLGRFDCTSIKDICLYIDVVSCHLKNLFFYCIRKYSLIVLFVEFEYRFLWISGQKWVNHFWLLDHKGILYFNWT